VEVKIIMARKAKKINTKSGIKRRGFASMDPDRRKNVASKGGKAAHKAGTAHEWSSEEARKAGKIGGSK
jgi:uncharacterized protein